MDLKTVIQCGVSQKEKTKNHISTYMWNLKNGTDKFICRAGREMQTEQICGHRLREKGDEWGYCDWYIIVKTHTSGNML